MDYICDDRNATRWLWADNLEIRLDLEEGKAKG